MKHLFVKNIAVVLLTVTLLNVKAQTIFVESKDNVIVLQVSPDKYLNMVYFGEKLSDTKEYGNIAKVYHLEQNSDGYNSAYTTSGTRNLLEPAISVIHADGNRSLDLHYVSHAVTKINDDVSLLSIVLRDSLYDFQVTLHYQTYYNDNVTEQWSVIEHHEKKDVVLSKYASANLYFQAGSYWLNHYHGEWAQEMRPEEEKLDHGIKTIDSKLGTRADLFQPPVLWFRLTNPPMKMMEKCCWQT